MLFQPTLIFLSLVSVSFAAKHASNIDHKLSSLLKSSVKAQIHREVLSVVGTFYDTGHLPADVLTTAYEGLNMAFLQRESGVTDATSSLDSLQNAIEKQLAQVELMVHNGFSGEKIVGGSKNGLGGSKFSALRKCIADVLSHKGHSGAGCLLHNGASVDDLRQIFEQVVNQYQFQLPVQRVKTLQKSIDKALAKSSLIPPAKQLVKDVEASMLSVVSAGGADRRNAVFFAEACFFEALSRKVYDPTYEHDCNVQNSNASTLNSIENLYRDTVNQFAGVLPVKVVEDVQAIGEARLGKITHADRLVRQDINDAIKSVVASYSGNTASLTYELIDCLDFILVQDADDEKATQKCLNAPHGPSAFVLNRIKGYLEQFYGVLPPKLILDLEDKLVASVKHQKKDAKKKAQQLLDDLFVASGAGPEYVTCFETYVDCVLKAFSTLSAPSVCNVGNKCDQAKFQTAKIDPISPYSAAASQVRSHRKPSSKGKREVGQDSKIFARAAQIATLNGRIEVARNFW